MLRQKELESVVVSNLHFAETFGATNNRIREALERPAARSKHGFEIFKLMAYQPATVKSFEEVKPHIVEQLKADKVQNLYARRLEKLTELSYQTPESLDLAANETGLKVKSTELFTKNGGDEPLTKNPEVIQAAFSHGVGCRSGSYVRRIATQF